MLSPSLPEHAPPLPPNTPPSPVPLWLYSKQEAGGTLELTCSVWIGKPSSYPVCQKALCPQTQKEVNLNTINNIFLTRLQTKLQTRLESFKVRLSLVWALLAETTNDLLVITQVREAYKHFKQGFGNEKEVSSLNSSHHHLARFYDHIAL